MSGNHDEKAVTEETNKGVTENKWGKVAEVADSEMIDDAIIEPVRSSADPQIEAISTPTHEELLAKLDELEINQDKMVRLLAEKENSIRRANIELDKANKYAVSKLIQELLAVLDSLELSLQAIAVDNEGLKSFRDGIEMTLKMLSNILEKQGVKIVNPFNEKFDPNFHEAISVQESKDVADGCVLNVLQKGYLLHDRLIRPAMVILAKGA